MPFCSALYRLALNLNSQKRAKLCSSHVVCMYIHVCMRQGTDLSRSRMGVFNYGKKEGKFWDVSEGVCHLQNPQGKSWRYQGVAPSVAKRFPACNAGSPPSVSALLYDCKAQLYCHLCFSSPLLSYIFHELTSHFLSLGCHKFTSVTHRINILLSALRKRDWHPTAPRQKADQTWLHGAFDRMLWPSCSSDGSSTWGGGRFSKTFGYRLRKQHRASRLFLAHMCVC